MSMNIVQQIHTTGTPAPNAAPLAEMQARSQWVLFRLEIRPGEDKPTKVPYNARTGRRAASNNPDTWSTYAVAKAAAANTNRYNGIMFIVSANDPYTVVDLDDVRDPGTGIIAPWAMEIVNDFNTYAEISVSGKGIHIIGRGKKIHDRCRNWKHDHGKQIEVYEWGRPLTVSDDVLPGFEAIRDIQQPLDRFITEHWIQHLKEPTPQPLASTGGVSLASTEIVGLARSHNPKFIDLYDRGDLSHHGGGHSEADAALCAMLAWYTKAPDQILEIWQSSALYRDKTNRKDYTDRTIAAALDLVTGQYDPDYGNHTGISLVLDNGAPLSDTSDMPSDVEALRAELARERALREQMQNEITGVKNILASPEYEAGAKLTAIGVYLEGLKQQRLRRKPTEDGYHLPAGWIGKTVGMKTATVNNNLNKLKKAGVVDRTVRSEEIEAPYRDIDQGSGEVTTGVEKRRGKKSYIKLPDNMIEFAAKVAEYRKDPVEEPEKRGGIRVPACDKHPDAQLVRRTAYYCEGCYHEAQRDGTPIPPPLLVSDPTRVQRDESDAETVSTPNFDGDTSTVINGYANFDVDPDDDVPIMPTCDYRRGGEECGEPTEAWEHDGYGSQTKCHKHAQMSRKSGAPPQRVTTTSRVLRTEVAS